MARILVTGGSGFVGRSIVDALAGAGHELHTMSRRPFARNGVAHHEVDLFDAAAVADVLERIRPSHVLHAAWFTEHGKFWEAPENSNWLQATTMLAQSCALRRVERFVGVGSVAEYDWSLASLGALSETTALRPSSAYGRAKAAAFKALEEIAGGSTMSFGWGRLFHVFGPGEPPQKVTSYIARELMNGRVPHLRQPDATYDFLDIGHVGEALAALLLARAEGAINIARGQGTSLAELAHLIGRILDVDMALVARQPLSATDPALPLIGDVSRLRKELNLPVPASLEQSLGFVRNL